MLRKDLEVYFLPKSSLKGVLDWGTVWMRRLLVSHSFYFYFDFFGRHTSSQAVILLSLLISASLLIC